MKQLFLKCLTYKPQNRLNYKQIICLIPELENDSITSLEFSNKIENV